MAIEPTVTAARRLDIAYLSVFGAPGTRNSDQQLVMNDIEAHCYAYRLVSEGKVDGEVALHRAVFNDGRRSVWLRIRGFVIRALTQPKEAKISRKKTVNQ